MTGTSVLLSAFLVLSLSGAAAAQQDSARRSTCPRDYSPVAGLCMHDRWGDVVEAPMATGSVSPPGCRPGYAHLSFFCMNLATGDVEEMRRN